MQNKFLRKFDNVVKIKITGKNISYFINKLIKEKINILNSEKISPKEIYLYIKYDDYLKLKDKRTIYKVELISYLGKLRIKKKVKKNLILFISIIIAMIIIYILSNMVFTIEVVHSSSKIRNLLYEELASHGIKEFTFKKDYLELEKIEDEILEDNKDAIEWLEIVVEGTKYTVRVEERKIIEDNDIDEYTNIVARKSAVITTIIAVDGEKVILPNTYVNKGDIIIRGSILKPDGSYVNGEANGTVLGEVWYTVDVEYPYIYREETLTGKTKEVYVINFLGKRISLFDFHKFNTFDSDVKVILQNNLLPINFVKEKQYEMKIIDDFYTEEEAINKAIELGTSKLLEKETNIKEIKDVTILTKSTTSSKVSLKLFVSVIEDIGEKVTYTPIPEENNKESQDKSMKSFKFYKFM